MCTQDLRKSMYSRWKLLQLHRYQVSFVSGTYLDLDHLHFQFPIRAVIQIVLVSHLVVTFIHLIALIQNPLDELLDRFPVCMRVLLQSLAGVAVLSELLQSSFSARLLHTALGCKDSPRYK
jgi:hypothetical protein